MNISPDGGPPSPTESSRSHDGGSPPSSLHPTPAPRWPLKPGVLVHINRTHSLRSGLGGSVHANDNLRIHSSSGGFANDRYRSRGPAPSIVRAPVRPFRRGGAGGSKETVNQRALSAVSVLHDEGMIARANRIRAMFGAQLKETDAFPGISREKTGEQIHHPGQLSALAVKSCTPFLLGQSPAMIRNLTTDGAFFQRASHIFFVRDKFCPLMGRDTFLMIDIWI